MKTVKVMFMEAGTESTHMNSKKSHGFSPLSAWALAFGCVIGWGSFVMPGTTFLPTTGPAGTGIAMAVGAALMLVIGFNFHYMMNRSSEGGGAYAYTKNAFGRDQAFLCAWFLSLSYIALIPQNASALALISRYFLNKALQLGFHYRVAGYDVFFGEILFSELIVLAFGLLFLFRERVVRHLQTLAALAILTGVGIVLCAGAGKLDPGRVRPSFGMKGLTPALGITALVMLAPWAFVGFDTLSLFTKDFRFSVKKSFRIITAAILIGAAVYTALTWLSAAAVPGRYSDWQAYIRDLDNLDGIEALPAFQAGQAILGNTGRVLLAISALGAVLGGIIGFYWASCRLLMAMAEDGILPERFRKHSVTILFIMGVSMIAPFFGRTALGWIVDISTIGAVIGFGYTSAAAWRTARSEGNKAVQITGAGGTVISVAFAMVLLIPGLVPVGTLASESYLMLALWSIIGFMFYWRTLRTKLKENSDKSLRIGIILLLLVVFSSLLWVRRTSQDTTEQVLQNLNHYNETELAWHGIELAETENADAAYYLEKQMRLVNDSLGISTWIQIALLLAALWFLLKIYQIILVQRQEMELQKLQAEERSKAKSELLFNMSHDIRTPMNAILGFTALARREKDLSPKTAEYLTKIDASGKSLLTLLNDVLEMSSIESGNLVLEPEKTDLRKVMNEARDMFLVQMTDKHITFKVETGNLTNNEVLCDRNRLGCVLLNLLSNACKFTPEGGEVLLSLTQTGAEEGTGSFAFQVRDNGIGMSPEFAEKLFDAFERERTSTVSGAQGTGLGMTITKRIVELMGGDIHVDTEPGRGTEFIVRLRLPLIEETADSGGDEKTAGLTKNTVPTEAAKDSGATGPKEAAGLTEEAESTGTADSREAAFAAESTFALAAAEAAGTALAAENRTVFAGEYTVEQSVFDGRMVLVVEDIEMNRDIAVSLLEEEGISTDEAENGKIAVDMVASAPAGTYDAILMDLQMPVMNGFEAARAIRALDDPDKANIPILAVTANTSEEDIRNTIAAGMNGHFAKPLEIEKLLAALAEVFEKGGAQ